MTNPIIWLAETVASATFSTIDKAVNFIDRSWGYFFPKGNARQYSEALWRDYFGKDRSSARRNSKLANLLRAVDNRELYPNLNDYSMSEYWLDENDPEHQELNERYEEQADMAKLHNELLNERAETTDKVVLRQLDREIYKNELWQLELSEDVLFCEVICQHHDVTLAQSGLGLLNEDKVACNKDVSFKAAKKRIMLTGISLERKKNDLIDQGVKEHQLQIDRS